MNSNCIYLLENKVTNDQYIGITDNLERRRKEHSKGSNIHLKVDIKKYGWNSFAITKLLIGTREYCQALEPKLISIYNCTKYNIFLGGGANPGETHHLAKLTEKEVIEIRNLYNSINITIPNLASKYSISTQQISRILRGERWASTPGIISRNLTKNKVANRRKLTDEEVVEVRNLFRTGWFKVYELADSFCVARQSLSKILDGISYKNLPGPIRGIDYE